VHRLLNVYLVVAHARHQALDACARLLDDAEAIPEALKESARALQTPIRADRPGDKAVVRYLEAHVPGPEKAPVSPAAARIPTEIGSVLIVEDEEFWRDSLVGLVRLHLGREPVTARTYEAATRLLENWQEGRTSGAEGRTHLVLLDLGLPRDEGGLAQGSIDRRWGWELLERLRAYAVNWPVIVLTAPGRVQDIHLEALRRGIAPEDYIYKWPGRWEEEVAAALDRIRAWDGRIESFEVLEPAPGTPPEGLRLRADGIEVEMGPAYLRTLLALGAGHGRALPAEALAERVRDLFGEEMLPDQVPDHVYQIRSALHRSLSLAGRSVIPEKVLETVVDPQGNVAYRVASSLRRVSTEGVEPNAPFRVLVVEDTEVWQDGVLSALGRFGYESRLASTVADAETLLREESFQALSLDLQLPADRQSEDTLRDGGLKVLRGAQESGLGIAALVLSELAPEDDLRAEATRLGVRATDFLNKSDPQWEDRLVRSLHRMELEFRRGGILPSTSPRPLYSITLQPGGRKVLVDGLPIRLSANAFSLMAVLARHANLPVPKGEILEAVWGDEENWPSNPENTLSRLVYRLRREYLEPAFSARSQTMDAEDIVKEAAGAYILRGRVVVEE
jgi:DNA-binding response OmpR family regulator